MNTNQRGQLILLKAFGGDPIIRRLWDVAEKGVYIVDESEWKLREEGLSRLEPVGFPNEDVFAFDELARTIVSAKEPIDWSKLTPFRNT